MTAFLVFLTMSVFFLQSLIQSHFHTENFNNLHFFLFPKWSTTIAFIMYFYKYFPKPVV